MTTALWVLDFGLAMPLILGVAARWLVFAAPTQAGHPTIAERKASMPETDLPPLFDEPGMRGDVSRPGSTTSGPAG